MKGTFQLLPGNAHGESGSIRERQPGESIHLYEANGYMCQACGITGGAKQHGRIWLDLDERNASERHAKHPARCK